MGDGWVWLGFGVVWVRDGMVAAWVVRWFWGFLPDLILCGVDII